MESFYAGKRILVTGAAGTIAKALVKKILSFKPAEIIGFDNNESELFYLKESLNGHNNFNVRVGDIKDKEKVKNVSRGIDIIFHCAAYKHVIFSEYDSFDYVQVNVQGTQNIIEAAIENKVNLVINTSSDKAVNPTNVMGTTKLLGEKLITAANVMAYGSNTRFSSVRFGNVLGSRGSILPLLVRQIKSGGPVTLTDEHMTRFIMSIDDAVGLVLESALKSIGGEVFVLKMKSVKIIDLIKATINILAPKFGYHPDDIEIEKIGIKPGEKLYEELMNEEEVSRTWELKNMFVVLPRFRNIFSQAYDYADILTKNIDKVYISKNEKFLSVSEIEDYLIEKRIIEYCMEEA